MNPFFFGDSDSPLFGVYHAPRSGSPRSEGVVLCYPLMQEYMRSHWAARNLCGLLASAGFHAMRFDYFATGDSAGESTEASLGRWRADIQAAVGELRDTSGVKKVSLVGLRLGGAVALEACAERMQIEDVVLWDPAVDGKAHLEELERMHRELYKIFPATRDHFKEPNLQEMLGSPLPRAMRGEIEALDLRSCTPSVRGTVSVVVSEEKKEYGSLVEALEAAGLPCVYRAVPDNCDWGSIGDFYHRMSPASIPKVIVELLMRNRK